MHKKYAQDGFAAVSVALDDPAKKDVKEKVLRFLKEKNAAFTNLILDEKDEIWQKKLDIEGPPCVFVFDREGKIAKKFVNAGESEEVEKLVVELLKKK